MYIYIHCIPYTSIHIYQPITDRLAMVSAWCWSNQSACANPRRTAMPTPVSPGAVVLSHSDTLMGWPIPSPSVHIMLPSGKLT